MAIEDASTNVALSFGPGSPPLHNLQNKTIWMWLWIDSFPLANTRLWAKQTGGFVHFLNTTGTGTSLEFQWTRATTPMNTIALLSNFSVWATGKWVFVLVTLDSATTGNNQMFMGDERTEPAQPSSYSARQTGSGAFSDDSSAGITAIGAGGFVRLDGRVASYGVLARNIAGDFDTITKLWQGRAIEVSGRVQHYEFGLWGATGVQPDLSGHGNHGVPTDIKVVDHPRVVVPSIGPWTDPILPKIAAAAAGNVFRRTRSSFGARVGSRQVA